MTEVNPKEDKTPLWAAMANLTRNQKMNVNVCTRGVASYDWVPSGSRRPCLPALIMSTEKTEHRSSSYMVNGSAIERGMLSVISDCSQLAALFGDRSSDLKSFRSHTTHNDGSRTGNSSQKFELRED